MRLLPTTATGLARSRRRALAAARADAAEEALAVLPLPDGTAPSVAGLELLNGAAILASGRAGVRECGRGNGLPAVASF